MFGAYTQCKWPKDADSGRVADPSGLSFLFSLINAADKTVRFSLSNKGDAIGAKPRGSVYFGWQRINCILYYRGQAANQANGNTANSVHKDSSYQPDDGDLTRGAGFFAGSNYFSAADIEVYEL